MPPAELSLFALRRRQCCKHTHTDTNMWPPTRTDTLTARILHTAHSSWPRTTNVLATPPRTVPLSFCTTRPVMLWLRAFAFVFRSCDKRRQFSHALYCYCCCCFVISLIWLQQQRWGGGWGEERNNEAGLAQFSFTWPRVSLLLCSRMPPLCERVCWCGVWWKRERARSLRSSPQTILLLPMGLLSVVVSLQTPVVRAGASFLLFTHTQCCQTVAIVPIFIECPYEGDLLSLKKEFILY